MGAFKEALPNQEFRTMLKILHTADWHIGQKFHDYERYDEHRTFFRWLIDLVKERQIDLLLVAGDVFDGPNPSAEAQNIYYTFLKEIALASPNIQLIITAGNHDSAARLEAPAPLLKAFNVFVRGVVKRNAAGEINYKDLLLPVQKEGRTVAWCMAVPYLRQGDYPPATNYSEGVAKLYETLHQHLKELNKDNLPVLAMGHLYASGATLSEGDRSERIIVGGSEQVNASAFDLEGVCYTALGHLHKGQRVAKCEEIRYAGSPLPMSFAEINYKQGVNLITLEGDKVTQERMEFTPPVQLLSLPDQPAELAQVMEVVSSLPTGESSSTSPFLELKVLIKEPEPSMRHQIEEILQHKAVRLAKLTAYINKGNKHGEETEVKYQDLKSVSPMQIAEETFERRYGDRMPETMKKLLTEVIEEVSA